MPQHRNADQPLRHAPQRLRPERHVIIAAIGLATAIIFICGVLATGLHP